MRPGPGAAPPCMLLKSRIMHGHHSRMLYSAYKKVRCLDAQRLAQHCVSAESQLCLTNFIEHGVTERHVTCVLYSVAGQACGGVSGAGQCP